ncbi:carboxypeptidase M32 [Spirochaetia bacterium]|nr:carboxypeptidase M32 [Spirochaetia bacterium]
MKAQVLEKLYAIDRECCYLENAAAILEWDADTYLPPDGVKDRSEQLAVLKGIHHDRFTVPEIGRLLAELGVDEQNPRGDEKLSPQERDFLKVFGREYRRAVKLPGDLVREAARAEKISQAAWVEARKNNDFSAFEPHLKTVIDLAKKKAHCWGFEGKAVYDGLLDLHEPGMTAADISAIFKPLRESLSALIRKIAAKPQEDFSFLKENFPADAQAVLNRKIAERLGFDYKRGRLDVTVHPFTTSLGFDDVRITTRYFPDNFFSGIFSTIHESGHAFYELGLSPEIRGSCLAGGVSMGIHESQSRLWENVIGRSRAFWQGQYPLVKEIFPDILAKVDCETFYKAANQVKSSLIRVDADEVSYSLHIILRFELEQRLFSGELDTSELPSAWRKMMKEYLGIENETDADGVLQDVHWSSGSFGYFPSYALGNLYGLQFYQTLNHALPQAEQNIAAGNFTAIHQWLRDTIYTWGRRLDPAELLQKVTGAKLSAQPFLDYIEVKYNGRYGL